MDVQIDISPDAGLSEAANRNKVSDLGDDTVCYFRVTCTVTNLGGVPCGFAVTDLWENSQDRKGIDNKYLRNGIVAGYGTTVMVSGMPIIDATAAPGNANGWLVYSHARGQFVRKNKDTRAYEGVSQYIRSAAPWPESYATDAWNALSTAAVKDLNNRVNPSNIMNQETMEVWTSGYLHDNGFLMHSGYSFTITNMYAVPAKKLKETGRSVIYARFFGKLFAPVVYYSKAYTLARPTVTSDKDSEDNTIYRSTWSLPSGTSGEVADSMKYVIENIWFDYRTNKHGHYE